MPLRWGFCGAGRISHDFAAAIASLKTDAHSFAAVAARDMSRAEAFAREFGFAAAYDDYDSIANSNDVDVVYIGIINTLHFDVASKMIRAGKHVLCEKPMTLHLDQTKELFRLAEEKGVFLMEAIWSRCFPLYDRIREEIRKGSIGEVLAVTCCFGQPINTRTRVANKEIGGGGLMDIGIYVVQLATMAFGGRRPESMSAAATKLSTGVDDSGSIFLRFGEGKFAEIGYSCKVLMKCDAVIYGSSGRIEIPEFFWAPNRLIVNGQELDFPLPSSEFSFNFPHSEGLAFEAEHVRACLEAKKLQSDKLSAEDSVIIHEIIAESLDQMDIHYD